MEAQMKEKSVFFCTDCGNEFSKWSGQCPACRAWNTLVEQPAAQVKKSAAPAKAGGRSKMPVKLENLDTQSEIRFSTGLRELDRVLGGGAVKGSLVLVGGAPGIGKSTLLLQICTYMGKDHSILYVTGEESERQLKLRADRLKVTCDNLSVLSETSLADILDCAGRYEPEILIVDSIQTLYSDDLTSAPGSVGQVKECTLALMQLAKSTGITVFVIGHVNKEGAIAGPKVLEHMVDCVLCFEGDGSSSYRILRSDKNRFGSTNEIGVFEMADCGLLEVENPSEMLLSGRPVNTPGTCVACVMEGTRPILAEIQALVTPSGYSNARKTSVGVDFTRAMLLQAVLEKRGGLHLSGCDSYINVIGGLYLNETAADLATVLAIGSSYRDLPVGDDLVAIGEVGLTGELRAVNHLNQRLQESARLGFRRIVVPKQGISRAVIPDGVELIACRTVSEALASVMGR